MKNFLKIFLVILIAIAVACCMYFVSDSMSRNNNDARQETTVTKNAVTEKSSERILLAELVDEDFHLYKQDDKVILTHQGQEYEYENWSNYIEYEKPQMMLNNIDTDDDLELLIRVVGEVVEDTGEKVYQVYVLNESVNEDTGEKEYFVTLLSRSTWLDIFDRRLKIEVSQLTKCDKVIQFAMCMISDNINYDRETGIADSSAFWFRALQDDDGNYLRIEKWNKGVGEYVLERDGIKLIVPVYVEYKDTKEIQNAGYIKCTMGVTKDFETYIRDYSMSFRPDPKYTIHKASELAEAPWSYTENNSNSGTYSTGDNVIDNIKYTMEFDPEESADVKTVNFATNDTELNNVSSIRFTESYVELTAKNGFTFSNDVAKRRLFRIVINDLDKKNKVYEIGYDASIYTNDEGNEVLKVNFDKTYPRDCVDSIMINIGER